MPNLSGQELFKEVERLTGLIATACVCDHPGCRKYIADTAAQLAALLSAPPRHPAAFRFDDDESDYDPTGQWADEVGDTWTFQGWLYPATGERPIPLMQLTCSADEPVQGALVFLPDLINEGAKREGEA